MDNPIYYNKEDMEFIEKNYEELSESIGSEEYKSKYYIGSFRYAEREFNTGAFYYQSLWFGYRKMYKESFIVAVLALLIPMLVAVLGILIISGGNLNNIGRVLDRRNGIGYSIILYSAIAISLVYSFIIGKYANSIYFKSLKKRVISGDTKRYGKSKLGILYGFVLGILGYILVIALFCLFIWLIIISIR